MWPFKKRKPEPAEEKAALEKLDEVTREVAAGELEKEAAREVALPLGAGELRMEGALQGPLHGDPDPIGEESGLRSALSEGEKEYDENHPAETT